jgi:phospholipid transport system substrate-binding protein
MLIKGFILLLMLYVIIWFAVPISASGGEAMQVVQSLLGKVTTVLDQHQSNTKEDRRDKSESIKKLISQYFDIETMAQESLGDTWSRITKQERKQFTNVFKDLFQDSYTGLVLNFLKKEELEFVGETVGQDDAKVQTRIHRANDTIPVQYFLKEEGKRLAIVDVDIDGVRIVQNYQQSFDNEIKRNSFASLMEKMNIRRKAIVAENQ